jgi:2-aminoethylphosphonate-pyruvate transaminase
MQGSGTYGIESVIEATTNENSNFLIIENGLYGKRIGQICDKLKIKYHVESFEENRAINADQIEIFLKANNSQFTNVGIIHSETSSGALNQAAEIGVLLKKYLPGNLNGKNFGFHLSIYCLMYCSLTVLS